MKNIELWKESHSVSQLGFHIVWCTKFRHKILVDKVALSVKRILAETCREYGWKCRLIEIMSDYVHLMLQISPNDRLVDVVRTLKSISAVSIFQEYKDLKGQKFWGSGLWSKDTYFGSVGQIPIETIIDFVESQKKKEKD